MLSKTRDPKWWTLINGFNELMNNRKIEYNKWWIGCENGVETMHVSSWWGCKLESNTRNPN